MSEPLSAQQMTRGSTFHARQFDRSLAPELFDPVLSVDLFRMSGPAFSPHPHAGFSAITYIFHDSEGGMDSRDSLGNEDHIAPGSVHLSRSSRGLVHDETPADGNASVRGLQIFLNLPANRQGDPPKIFHVGSGEMPENASNGVTRRIAVEGCTVGIHDCALPNPALIAEFELGRNANEIVRLGPNLGEIVICIAGSGNVDGQGLFDHQALALRNRSETVHEVPIISGKAGSRFIVVFGEQLRQSIYQSGPMILADPVMLDRRVAAYRGGEFGLVSRRSNLKL